MRKKTVYRYVTKKYVFSYMLAMLLLFLLSEPSVAIEGARFGLILWANRLLPSLLPFLILTQILIISGYLDAITGKLGLPYPYFVLFAGTLFGFPMGAKLSADLCAQGRLSKKEASLLCIIANHMSPAFVGGYVLSETLGAQEMIPVTYLILYLPSVCCGLFMLRPTRKKASRAERHTGDTAKKSTPGLRLNFAILDAAIMNSFETMLKLGGYVMLFSILTHMCRHFLVAFPALCTLAAGLLEITGAIGAIDGFFVDAYPKYVAILTATAFGGISGIAQTASLLRPQGKSAGLPIIPITRYICGKCILAGITALLAMLLYPLAV